MSSGEVKRSLRDFVKKVMNPRISRIDRKNIEKFLNVHPHALEKCNFSA
jgi:hypothetical protein